MHGSSCSNKVFSLLWLDVEKNCLGIIYGVKSAFQLLTSPNRSYSDHAHCNAGRRRRSDYCSGRTQLCKRSWPQDNHCDLCSCTWPRYIL